MMMGHEVAIETGEMAAAFIRAKFASRCCSCGGKIEAGELIHWARDSKRTWVTHPSWCPGEAGERQKKASAEKEAAWEAREAAETHVCEDEGCGYKFGCPYWEA
jgi:hypothetical protein